MSTVSITHIVGFDVIIDGRFMRQRCAWCGVVLLDYDLENISVVVDPGEVPELPAVWPVGCLVRFDGGVSLNLEGVEDLPDDACSNIDDEVTR